MPVQDAEVTAIAHDDEKLEEEANNLTGMDAAIGPVESMAPRKYLTPPGVIAVLVRKRTPRLTGSVEIIGDETHGTPEPAPNVATGREMADEYSLLAIMPGQLCRIVGRPEVRFFRQRGATATTPPTPSAPVPAPPKLQTLKLPVMMPFNDQQGAAATSPSTPDQQAPKLSVLEPPVTLPFPPIPSFPM